MIYIRDYTTFVENVMTKLLLLNNKIHSEQRGTMLVCE